MYISVPFIFIKRNSNHGILEIRLSGGWWGGIVVSTMSQFHDSGGGEGGWGGWFWGYPGGESFLVSATHNQLKRALRQTRFEGFEAHGGP